MKLRTRVILIVIGVIIFAIAAPVVIFFASGIRYNPEKNTFEKTGALLLRTEPRGAAILLDSEPNRDTPRTVRFLLPGDYQLRLEKANYRSWEKRVTIHQGLVTNPAPLELDKIFLLLSKPERTLLPTTTTEFTNLPRKTSPDYIFQTSATSTVLIQKSDSGEPVILARDIPEHQTSQIIVSQNRQIFLLLDKTLYQVGEGLKKINENVKYAYWDEVAGSLLYGNPNEAWLYRPLSSLPNLLAIRSSTPLGVPVYNKKTGYLFIQAGGELKAIEVTDTGQALSFTLAQVESPNVPFSVNEDGTIITYQDGENIYSLKIR